MGLLAVLPLADKMEFGADSIAPITDALAYLREDVDRDRSNDFRFGYGRTLAYLPLVALSSSLFTFALLRAAAHALMAPIVYAAARCLRVSWVPAAFAGLCTVCSQGLVTNLVMGSGSYMAVEWVCVALLGFGLSHRGWDRVGPGLLGAALPIAAMNHPLSSVAAVMLPALWFAADVRKVRAVGIAVAASVIVGGGHVVEVLLGGGLGELSNPGGAGAPDFDRLMDLVGAPGSTTLILVAGVVSATLCVRRLQPVQRALVAVTAVALVLTVCLSVLSHEPHSWYWRPAVPLCALCVALAVDVTLRRGWRVVACGLVALPFVLSLDAEHHSPRRWSTKHAGVIREVSSFVDADGRARGLAGYGRKDAVPVTVPATLPLPVDFSPFLLDAVLAGRLESRWGTTPERMEVLPQLIAFEVPGDDDEQPEDAWVVELLRALPGDVVVVKAGLGGAAVAVDSVEGARAVGELACQLAPGVTTAATFFGAVPGYFLVGSAFATDPRIAPPGTAACAEIVEL